MTVKIYQPVKNAMQSGKAKYNCWLLENIDEDTRFIEPLMGWTGNDTSNQMSIKFKTLDDAVNYAKKHSLEYEIIKPQTAKTHIRAYSDNFM